MGRVWGGVWEGFGAFGDLLSRFLTSFFMLVFGMVFKSRLGGFWIRFCLDFKGFAKDFGRVWRGFWEGC